MTTFAEAKKTRDALTVNVHTTATALLAICEPHKNAIGLTPDRIKSTKEYQDARVNYNIAFTKLQDFNAVFTRQFKIELRDERRAKQQEREALAQTK